MGEMLKYKYASRRLVPGGSEITAWFHRAGLAERKDQTLGRVAYLL